MDKTQLGLATSLTQFSRSIGAAVGVAVMGAILAREIAGTALPGGIESLASSGMALSEPVRQQFAAALHRAFLAGLAASGAGLVGALFLPPLGHVVARAGGRRRADDRGRDGQSATRRRAGGRAEVVTTLRRQPYVFGSANPSACTSQLARLGSNTSATSGS